MSADLTNVQGKPAGRKGPSVRWTVDTRDAGSVRDVRKLLLAHLRAQGCPDADYAGAELVAGELLGNVVRYAPGIVDIEVEWRGNASILHVLDRGPGYELATGLPSFSSESGRGLFLVSELSRGFTVTRRPQFGSHTRVVLPVERRSRRLTGILWSDRCRSRGRQVSSI